ncbi:hypothetical protein [Rhizobium sp. K7/93]
MQFEGALVREQGVTFAIVIVKPHVLNSGPQADEVAYSFQPAFPGVPIVLMARKTAGASRHIVVDVISLIFWASRVLFLADEDPDVRQSVRPRARKKSAPARGQPMVGLRPPKSEVSPPVRTKHGGLLRDIELDWSATSLVTRGDLSSSGAIVSRAIG